MKGRYPPELIQKIRDTVNIIEVVGEHVVLRKSGANHSGLCPFHSERSPSFSVNETKGVYHCYGCKKGGDLFSFVMDIFGISFPEAVEELADRARIAMPKELGGAAASNPEEEKRRQAAREKLATAYKLNRFVAAFYHQQLGLHAQAKEYLESRGVTGELLRNFYVGVAPSGWDGLSNHLVAKKAPLPIAQELGLIRPSPKREGSFFDLFRDRAMFPILDMRGKVAGFGGRALSSEVEGPKYLNSPESLVFHKSRLAFGLYQAQKHVREKDEIILVEGYFDVLGMHAAGFENAVATCGTSLTSDHLQLFRKFASRITVLFDGDKAGISATERVMETALEHGIVLYGAVMPEGLDPDELLLQPEGKQRMTRILEEAKPLLDSRIEAEIQASAEGPEARTRALKQIGSWLKKFNDPVGREIRIEAVLEGMRISRPLLGQAMGEKLAPVPISAPRPARRPAPRSNGGKREEINPGERILLGGLARGGEFASALTKSGGDLPPGMKMTDIFETPAARQAAEWLASEKDEAGTTAEIDPQVRSTITEAQLAPEAPFSRAQFDMALGRALGRIWARFSQRIKTALADAEAKKDAGLQARLMKEYLDVQRKMKEFTSFYDEA